MSPRPGLFSKALNSEFPNLEAFICFVIDFSEYTLKEDSEHTPKYGPKKISTSWFNSLKLKKKFFSIWIVLRPIKDYV